MNERIDNATRAKWRTLGFFYDRDDDRKEWILVGSRAGLMGFARLLRDYADDPRHAGQSEHEHYGPYQFLEVMTWPEAGLDAHSIHGSPEDLKRLAALVETRVVRLEPGAVATIGPEFASTAPYKLIVQLRADDFDPASADSTLNPG